MLINPFVWSFHHVIVLKLYHPLFHRFVLAMIYCTLYHVLSIKDTWVISWWRWYSTWDHRLRGSASTVLTATGQVNGNWQILTPYRIATPEPIATKFGTIDYVSQRTPKRHLVQIHPLGLLGKWVKYNVFVPFLFIYTFISETRAQVKPVNVVLRAIAQ